MRPAGLSYSSQRAGLGTWAEGNGGPVLQQHSTGSARRPWLAPVVLSQGVSLIVIDGTIVNVSLPVIIRDLKLNFTDAEWGQHGLLAGIAALLITSGRLGDGLGRGVRGREPAAGVTGTTAQLIVARVVQGVGGALSLSGTLPTVNATFRSRSRGWPSPSGVGHREHARHRAAARQLADQKPLLAVDLPNQHAGRRGHPGGGDLPRGPGDSW